ncbi:thioredoxin [Defluviimonas sp. 20V17]|uniref:MJ0042 family finger-like domain-containing protein n=1 Tax=Allgaiera indica TaxID=765699 RepID=A0AAN4UT64_9RHOB|nr:zinc-ribbon domain-containing protein [Allgaiera indica]KDB05557.1 thioredoxin [Defluviimonas sp. 20V17]GHE03605.1 hypothetical protein GCM10008024_27630 [Allgaiera indica]SDX44822.1 MJ0042 family finger-like domain-containing protein [Allgaiera indica]
MRLTCPNCDAQYEVDDNAIPETGRDVQCSNCGHAWFQLPAELEDDLPPEDRVARHAPQVDEAAADGPAPTARPGPEGAHDADPLGGPDGGPEGGPEGGEDGDQAQDPASAPMPTTAGPRRSLDDGLKRLLREEADRERTARKAEAGGIETQPELGLDAAEAGAEPLHQDAGAGPDADVPAPDTAAEAEAPALAGGARRDLLPDIEEINSTLRANSERGPEEPGASADVETPAERKRGFRLGFSVVLLVAVVLALLYLYAPMIARQVPAAAGPLKSYVQTVDEGRIRLNDMMQNATRALTGGTSGNGG